MSEPKNFGLRVTVEDLNEGATETVTIPAGDYLLITCEPCERAHVVAYANGTHVITVKGRSA